MPVELGLGAAEALSVVGVGRVAGVYPKAAYLRLPGGLMALTSPDVPSGPAHARAAVEPGRLRVGDRVVVTPDWLEAGVLSIDLRGATRWRGELPPPAAALGLAVELLVDAPPSSLVDGVDLELLRRGDLARLADALGGAGPGLTPAGDDCLAGVLLVARLRWGPLGDGVVGRVQTNAVSRMYLHLAARGQSIEPVHRFLFAAAAGDSTAAATALGGLLAFGHRSGADLALGLRLALELLPPESAEASAGSRRAPVR